MKRDFSQRFGFLVSDVAKLHGERFDRLARERIGLSRAQVRLLGALAQQGGAEPLTQIELANRLSLSAMAVAGLCERLDAAGWIFRTQSSSDRRANEVHLAPKAEAAFDAALAIGDELQAETLADLSAAERAQLLALLRKTHARLLALAAGEAK
jgi:DNA-binding MarR family transcriptional regulator